MIKNDELLKYIPAIILTTSNNPTDIYECYKTGIAGYIVKPLKYDDYVKKIQKTLEYWSVNELIIKIHEKILRHDKSYLNKFVALYLQVELQELKKQITLLDKRLQLLLEILKIYLPISH